MRSSCAPITLLAALLLGLASPGRADDHPASQYNVIQIPAEPMSGQITFITGIGPPNGVRIVHASVHLTFVTSGNTPASDLEFHVSTQVDGATAQWEVTGTDLGFGGGPGTFSGSIGTHALNGVVSAPLGLPGSVVNIQIADKNGGVSGQFLNSSIEIEWNTTLVNDVPQISLATGGAQKLQLNAGATLGGSTYLILGSISGTAPGTQVPGGTLPLVFDGYTLLTLTAPNSVILSNSLGTLNASGRAAASFQLPPLADPALIGLSVHHAYAVLDASGQKAVFTSIPVPVHLVP